jgi:small subunit ribosomal protein S1
MTREDPHTLQPDAAWTAFVARHAVGDVIQVTVTRSLPFGSLVEAEGVPGLLIGPDLAIGAGVEAPIGALDPDRRRFSMSR